MHYLVNALSVSAKSIRKVYLALTGSVASSYFQNLRISQKCHPVGGTYHRLKSAFLHLVVYVVLIAAREKMGRISTARHVAAVQNVHTFRNQTVIQFPLRAMDHYFFGEGVRADVPIAFRIGVPHPQPATAFRDSFSTIFKPFRDGYFACHRSLLSNRKITLKQEE